MTNRIMNDEQVEYYLTIYKGRLTKETCQMMNDKFGLNLTPKQLTTYNMNHGLRVSYPGQNLGQFKKGMIPFNKGLKLEDYMSEEGLANCKKTRFQKGHKPIKWLPIGTVVDSRDGLYIKYKDESKGIMDYKPLSHLMYEFWFGQIPKEHIVTFLDGNNRNFAKENLIAITRKENAMLNHHVKRSSRSKNLRNYNKQYPNVFDYMTRMSMYPWRLGRISWKRLRMR